MSGWFQYRSTRTAQRQARLLSYENRIGERRISTYLDTLRVVLPIKRWLQEYIAGNINIPPALEIDQELLVSLAAFGSEYVNNEVADITKSLKQLSGGFSEPLADIYEMHSSNQLFKEFETALAQSKPEAYAAWIAMKSSLEIIVKLLNIQINKLEQVIRHEVQDVSVPSKRLGLWRDLWRLNRRLSRESKEFRDSRGVSKSDSSSKGDQP
jgi:hypothetical protein